MNTDGKLSQEKFVEMLNEIYTIGQMSESVNTKAIVVEIINKINKVIMEN